MTFPNKRIQALIEIALTTKMANFNPESGNKPIHNRLLGEDRMIMFSIIHSINTNIGTSIYEPVARELAIPFFEEVDTQVKLSGNHSTEAQREISAILNELSLGNLQPNQNEELERIRLKAKLGDTETKKMTNIDVFLRNGNDYYFIDIKTAKPNKDGVQKYKQTALEWMATHLYDHPEANVIPIVGIPYNPYYPKPYDRWTFNNFFDTSEKSQLLVAEEFWNFLSGGENIYDQLLECFQIVGDKMRDEIDRFIGESSAAHPERRVIF